MPGLWCYGTSSFFLKCMSCWKENGWQQQGRKKQVLQGMIRAAGVYVQLDRGNTIGANKMAAKAVQAFVEHRGVVPAIFDLDVLLEKLEKVDPIPPKLTQ